jgi:hypothetical protein
MLKNNLQGLLVISLLKQINIKIMDTHHLDFLSPANETPREKNFDDVYVQLDREDALIVEEHIDNIPRINLNYTNCVAFLKNYLIEAVVEGNYEIVKTNHLSATISIKESIHELWIGNGAEYFKFYEGWFSEKSFTTNSKFSEIQKQLGYDMVMKKISEMPKTEKSILQDQIDKLTNKMNAL